MAVEGYILDIKGNPVGTISSRCRIELKKKAHHMFGLCLGSAKNDHGDKVGWRFARCVGHGVCSHVEIVSIIVSDEEKAEIIRKDEHRLKLVS